MSAEKISELEKSQAVMEANLNRVLKAVEKQANSTEKLTESVTALTTNLSTNISETKELRSEVKGAFSQISELKTDVAVIKRGNSWQPWAERAIVAALMAGVLWAMTNAN